MVRERRRVARILFVLAVIFAMCWLPYNLLTLFLDLDLMLDKYGLDQVILAIFFSYFYSRYNFKTKKKFHGKYETDTLYNNF